ncbi:MAG: recombinase family protein, partial [Actinomycetota bacterium]|nr:recombinase family protein [Actinomycetota bacterium]
MIVYTRVSRDASGQSRSVGEQETECRRLVEREGWTLVAVESDNDVSASRFARKAREGWQRVVERLAAGEAD